MMLPTGPGFDFSRLNAWQRPMPPVSGMLPGRPVFTPYPIARAPIGQPGISPTWGAGPGTIGGPHPITGSPIARAPLASPIATSMMQAPSIPARGTAMPAFANPMARPGGFSFNTLGALAGLRRGFGI